MEENDTSNNNNDEHDNKKSDNGNGENTKVCRFLLHTGKCRAGDECSFSHVVSEIPDCDHWTKKGHCKWKNKCFKKHDKAKRGGKGKSNGTSRPTPKRIVQKKTLLEKLMVDDEHIERAILLECMKHMVEKNFFVPQDVAEAVGTFATEVKKEGAGEIVTTEAKEVTPAVGTIVVED
jgi:hypothetical protein